MPAPTPSTGYLAQGVTTIKWGTDGMTGFTTVIDFNEERDVEKMYVENGTGVPTTRILLDKGARWNITIVDDTRLTPPIIGAQLVMTDVLSTGVIYTFQGVVVENNYQAARKQEGHRIIQVESLTLVDTTAASGNPSL
jgi:hypothetical protein